MIGVFIFATVLFVLMTAFPFLLALGIPKKEQATLVVRKNNSKDPRYFPRSFQKIIRDAWNVRTSEELLILSRPEPFAYAEELPANIMSVTSLVICKNDFTTREMMNFDKEIYSEHDVVLEKRTQARAVKAKVLRLKEQCTILRWCDGEDELYARRGCDLGISATSTGYLQLMESCTFHRLYAPQIDILAHNENRPLLAVPAPSPDMQFERKLALKDVRVIREHSVIEGNVITKYPLIIEEGVLILGHVKSKEGVLVKKGSKIDGNLFANGTIILQDKVLLTGDAFSQQDIYVGPDCVIGQAGKIKSVVAKEAVFLCEDVTVYGYVGCDGGGLTLSKDAFGIRIGKLLPK